MSDLISRKALFEEIQANSYRLIDRCNSFGQGMFLDGIKQAIDHQPTAYDPDKVVEALEKEYQEAKKEYNLDAHSYYEGKMIAFDNAITIVKKGGV